MVTSNGRDCEKGGLSRWIFAGIQSSVQNVRESFVELTKDITSKHSFTLNRSKKY